MTVLERTTFSTSRLLEFFTEKELQMQIGFGRQVWPMALTKELIDNALDACETAGIAPGIAVSLENDQVSVQDNGPGLPAATLARSLDYTVRVSDKTHYVSPSRGQLGNALKCVWAAPFVVDGERGRVDVVTGGLVHQVDVSLDRIAQCPSLDHTTRQDGLVKTGTLVTMYWPDVAGLLNGSRVRYSYNVQEMIGRYAVFNPHAAFAYRGVDAVLSGQDAVDGGSTEATYTATASDWRKWTPGDPTSPHWYTVEQLQTLIAAYVADERGGGRSRTVREFVAEFRGLAGTAKQKAVTDATGFSGAFLRDLVSDGDIDRDHAAALLAAMQREARPVSPTTLGVIGQEHFTKRLSSLSCVDLETVRYAKRTGEAGDLPFVVEVVFCAYNERRDRELVIGLNWSPTLNVPFGLLQDWLGEAFVEQFDPVMVIVHLACPRLEFVDRGKSRLALPDEISDALEGAIRNACKEWTKIKRTMKREQRATERETARLTRRKQVTIKSAAYRVMPQAYAMASANGTLPANARQIMYAARPLVLALTGGELWKTSSYFTQVLLPDYVNARPHRTAEWDVVFDARGHFAEPHTERTIGLGTLEVRRYIEAWREKPDGLALEGLTFGLGVSTCGPAQRYKYALFVEKEGFNELLAAVKLADRYDLAVMSTKGMSVTAARQLVEELSKQGVTILVIRDFDKAGFTIAHTLQADTRRYQFETTPDVIDLGLRLADVRAMGLQSEEVTYRQKADPRDNLRECGATWEECDFLVHGDSRYGRMRWTGERVELNAMTSAQFVAWLEGKLNALGVSKVVPSGEVLAATYRKAMLVAEAQKAIERVVADFDGEAVIIPGDLRDAIERMIDGEPRSWAWAIEQLARESRLVREMMAEAL